MRNPMRNPLNKLLVVIAISLAMLLLQQAEAEARKMGRIGGKSFRSFSNKKSYSNSRGSYSQSRSKAISNRRSYDNYRGGGIGGLVVLPGMSFGSPGGASADSGMGLGGLVFLLVALFILYKIYQGWKERELYREPSSSSQFSIMRLNIGFLGNANTIQRKLANITQHSQTINLDSWGHLLQEVIVLLLRNQAYIKYSQVGTQKTKNVDQAESVYESYVVEERAKSDEGISNVDGRFTGSDSNEDEDKERMAVGQYIVVTLVAAMDYDMTASEKPNLQDLMAILQKMATVPADRVVALQIFWTPQSEEGVLTEEDMYTLYPEMNIV